MLAKCNVNVKHMGHMEHMGAHGLPTFTGKRGPSTGLLDCLPCLPAKKCKIISCHTSSSWSGDWSYKMKSFGLKLLRK